MGHRASPRLPLQVSEGLYVFRGTVRGPSALNISTKCRSLLVRVASRRRYRNSYVVVGRAPRLKNREPSRHRSIICRAYARFIAQVLVDAPSFNSFRAISQTLTLVFAIDRPARIILRPFRWCRSVCDFAVRFAQSVEVVSGAVVAFVSGGTARNLGASQVNQQTTHMPALEPKLTKFSCEQRTIESDRN